MKRAKLAAARHRKYWTLEQAAEAIGVAATTLSRWENGDSSPHAYNLQRLCEAYGAADPGELGLEQSAETWPTPLLRDSSSEELDGPASDELRTFFENDLELRLQCLIYTWLHQKKQVSVVDLQERMGQEIESDHMNNQNYQKHEEVDRQRRDALRRLALLPVQALGLSTVGSALSFAPEDILTHCAAGITACGYLSKGHYGDMTLAFSVLSAYLPALKMIVKESLSNRKEAARLVAQALSVKATLGVHREGPQRAASYAQQGLIYSKECDDLPLRLTLLRRLAWIYSCDKHWKRALETALEAQFLLAHTSSPINLSIQNDVFCGVAQYQAQNGQKEQALAALRSAHDASSSSSGEDEKNALPFQDRNHSTFLMDDGLTHYFLGQYGEAFASFSQVIDPETLVSKEPASSERVRVEILNYQTLASLKHPSKDRDRSLSLWEAAIQGAKALHSEQRFCEALTAYDIMEALWPDDQRVKDRRELTRHW